MGRKPSSRRPTTALWRCGFPAGEAEIRFDYHTPGLKNGAIVSLCGLVVLGCYLFINKKAKPAPAASTQLPLEEFLEEKDKGSEPEESPDDKEE